MYRDFETEQELKDFFTIPAPNHSQCAPYPVPEYRRVASGKWRVADYPSEWELP